MTAAVAQAELAPPDIQVPEPAPVPVITSDQVRALGDKLNQTFQQYRSDRRIAELKWLKNLRQYLGIYDPEIEKELSPQRSKAYPRITRVKCISVASRVMNLMFPGDERNWALTASPSPDMDPQDVGTAIQSWQAANQGAPLTDDILATIVQKLATERAAALSTLIDDQLEELGGDQTQDYIGLNRKVVRSSVMYGLGLLRGPFVREQQSTKWQLLNGTASPQTYTCYKPMFEFLPVWDFYPDMSAKTLDSMDGYFTRAVMARTQLRALADRDDFFGELIKDYLARTPTGNFKALEFETELRAMGITINVNVQKADSTKYEVICWNGPVSANALQLAGVEVPEDKLGDEIDAEVWMVDGNVIKADMNPWTKLGVNVKTIHHFLFDEDDTAPVGNGLPNIVRDSQMSVAASTRMLLDNASVVCGPNVELNTSLLRPDQDLTSVSAYKIWYREGEGPDAQFPAVRNIEIDAHLGDLSKIIEMFMGFADMETFVGPQTGGDMSKGPSEPFRTAAGASMLRGDAALPFKDIVRNFDSFTQSVIYSLVEFNRKFNPDKAQAGDYNVIARGATSLIAKEIRGVQLDTLAATLSPEDRDHIDDRKLIEARCAVRDLNDMLVPADVAAQNKQARQQQMADQAQAQEQLIAAQVREALANAFKNIAQGQKNIANASAVQVQQALDILERGLSNDEGEGDEGGAGKSAARSQG